MLNIILQSAASGGAAGSALVNIMPLILIMVVFYFILIRPQNQRMKKHRQMLSEIQRGDMVVTGGGLLGKVIKVMDDELTLELGDNIKVKAMRYTIADVRNRTEPAKDKK